MTTIVNQGGPGSWTITDDAATAIPAALALLTAQLTALNGFLISNIGPSSVVSPGTIGAAQKVQASSLKDISATLSTISQNLDEATSQLQLLQSAIGTLTSHVADMSVTQKLGVIDQVKNNNFQQQATNASLQRSGFPTVTVQQQDVLTTIKSNVNDLSIMDAETKAASLIENAITSATSRIATYLTSYVENSFIGVEAAALWTQLKAWLATIMPDKTAQQVAVQTNAQKNTVLVTGDIPPPSTTA